MAKTMDMIEIEFAIALSRQPVSLDEEFSLEGGNLISRKDFLVDISPGPEEIFLERENRRSMENIVDRLSDRERMVIRIRFRYDALPDWVEPGIVTQMDREASMADIAKVLRLSRERVRQIEAEALKKIKKFIEGKGGKK